MLQGDDIGYHMYLDIEQEFDFMTPPENYDEMEWPGPFGALSFTWITFFVEWSTEISVSNSQEPV